MHRTTRALAVAALLPTAAAAALTACTDASTPAPRVVVRVATSAQPEPVEVHLAQPRGAFRSVHVMRPGQTRAFAVPAGWVTVRVPGLCVVPTRTTAAAVVEVDRRDCTLRPAG